MTPTLLRAHFLLGWRERIEVLLSGKVVVEVVVRDGVGLEARLDTGEDAK